MQTSKTTFNNDQLQVRIHEVKLVGKPGGETNDHGCQGSLRGLGGQGSPPPPLFQQYYLTSLTAGKKSTNLSPTMLELI